MAIVYTKPDNLDETNRQFDQTPLAQPLFINSVPKSGSHLLRNIIRMFVPVEQQYKAQFIQWANLQQHYEAFDPASPMMSWGHLFFSDASAIETSATRRILLVRDPYDWVLARARFFVSDEFQGNLDQLRNGKLGVGELLNLMIFGIHQKAPALYDVYVNNAAAWLGTNMFLVRYEELVTALRALDTPQSDQYFSALLDACGIIKPDDWRARVTLGADREQSGTARENLTGPAVAIPDTLPDTQKKLVELAVPGLRALLGYG